MKCDYCRKRYTVGEECPFCGEKPRSKGSHIINMVLNVVTWFFTIIILLSLLYDMYYYKIWGVLFCLAFCPVTYWVLRYFLSKKLKDKIGILRAILIISGWIFGAVYGSVRTFNEYTVEEANIYIAGKLDEKYSGEKDYRYEEGIVYYNDQNPKERYMKLMAKTTYYIGDEKKEETVIFYFDSVTGGFNMSGKEDE